MGTAEPPIVTCAFVGRGRELGELRAALEDIHLGRGRMFLISCEPGFGKTRLAEEILWSRCWEREGSPAYRAIIQILCGCSERPNSAQVVETFGSAADVES
jgi:hypothetical protein